MGSHDPLIGRVIAGKIEIQSFLGGGTMGSVYRAHHRPLDKSIAIKVLKGAASEIATKRLRTEARAASRLDHPCSMRVLDFGADGDDGLLYIAMEYLEGRTFKQVLQAEGTISPVRAARIVAQICAALQEAHDLGILHRDLKPANVMLVKRNDGATDFVKVCDYGLAKVFEGPGREEITRQGMLLGTPGYMAPEQVSGKTLDGRADVYACGIMLFRACAGRTPFTAKNLPELIAQQTEDDPPSLSEIAPGVDAEFSAIVANAVARDRERRWPSAQKLREALLGYLERSGFEESAPSETAVDPTIAGLPTSTLTLVTRRNGAIFGAALALAIASAATVAMTQTKKKPEVIRPVIAARETITSTVTLEPVAPPTVRLEVTRPPPGTEVWLDGKLLGTVPGKISFAWSGMPATLTFRADGYVPASHTIESPGELALEVPLVRRTPDKKPITRSRDRLEDPFGGK